MTILCITKKEALKIKKDYIRQGLNVRIESTKNNVFIDGKKVRYIVKVL